MSQRSTSRSPSGAMVRASTAPQTATASPMASRSSKSRSTPAIAMPTSSGSTPTASPSNKRWQPLLLCASGDVLDGYSNEEIQRAFFMTSSKAAHKDHSNVACIMSKDLKRVARQDQKSGRANTTRATNDRQMFKSLSVAEGFCSQVPGAHRDNCSYTAAFKELPLVQAAMDSESAKRRAKDTREGGQFHKEAKMSNDTQCRHTYSNHQPTPTSMPERAPKYGPARILHIDWDSKSGETLSASRRYHASFDRHLTEELHGLPAPPLGDNLGVAWGTPSVANSTHKRDFALKYQAHSPNFPRPEHPAIRAGFRNV